MYRRLFLGMVFLSILGPLAFAQMRPPSFPGASRGPLGGCRDIAVEVTDMMGAAIMGAAVSTQDSGIEMTTDSNGVADIPCRAVNGMMPMVEVRANGFHPERVALTPDMNFRYTVRLNRKNPPNVSGSNTISVDELYPDVQQKSLRLQEQAAKALAIRDYEGARRLYLEALQLTPSSPIISNNLGVISLHLKDLDSAGKWFQKAAEEAPYKPDILGNLGLVLWMQGRMDESYDSLKKALVYGYESNLAHYILGTVGLRKGESEAAVQHLKKASRDRFPQRDLYLSIALRNCGKTKDADASFRDFLKHNPAPLMAASPRNTRSASPSSVALR
ncbi:MAG: tetratricopeptide repeat protein [Acidobacteria bacterium]|nr:tetratricopeptide repeat protein [Acidobacteriota bacterium]